MPPIVTGLADEPTGAAGSRGMVDGAGAGAMPGLDGTSPVGRLAFGSAGGGMVESGPAGISVEGLAGGVGMDGSLGGVMASPGGWLPGGVMSCA